MVVVALNMALATFESESVLFNILLYVHISHPPTQCTTFICKNFISNSICAPQINFAKQELFACMFLYLKCYLSSGKHSCFSKDVKKKTCFKL